MLVDWRSQQAVDVAEDFADGKVTRGELEAAWHLAGEAPSDPTPAITSPFFAQSEADRAAHALTYARSVAGYVARCTVATHIGLTLVLHRAKEAASYAAFDASDSAFTACDIAEDGERIGQAALLRCIFGNPFRPVAIDPRWRSADVVALARGIYEERAFDQLPLLADALMDAGCDDGQAIGHCRSEGPHARGCWVVDLVLGKE